jgi:hypothetical protein
MAERPNTGICLEVGWGFQTCALGVDELPKHHQVMVHVEEPEMNVKESLELLDRHNEGWDTDERVTIWGSESRDAMSSLPSLVMDHSRSDSL